MKSFQASLKNVQQGAATLFITVIILFATTLVIIYAAKIGLEDLRISGNDTRAKEAFSVAEAGLNRAMVAIQLDHTIVTPTTSVTLGPATISAGSGTYTALIYTTTNGIAVTSTGGTADGTGTAVVREQYGEESLFGAGPDAPMIVGGTMPAVGGMEVIANPNGGGSGIPVSVWSSDTITFSGSGGSCQLSEYLASNGLYPTDLSVFTLFLMRIHYRIE